jgi:hypothetical protein
MLCTRSLVRVRTLSIFCFRVHTGVYKYIPGLSQYIQVCTRFMSVPGLCQEQTDTWRKERLLRLHHAGIAHLVEMVNKFASEDKHLLCADGQVRMSMY